MPEGAAADEPKVPTVRGQALASMEMAPGSVVLSAADRVAALTARAADAPCAMIHLAEHRAMRLIGGYRLPSGFRRMDAVPVSSTLAGLVIHYGFPVVISDIGADARVPLDAPVRSVGAQAYAGFPVRDPAGDIVGVCAVLDYRPRQWQGAELAAVDEGAQACTTFVADRYARQAAEAQRSFLDTLLDSLDTGVLACDADGRLVVVNRALRMRLGVEPVDGPPERWVTGLPLSSPDGRSVPVSETPLVRALGGEHVRGVEQVAQTVAGGRRLYSVNGHPIAGPAGRQLGAVAVFHDITERRRGERFRGCELAVTLALSESENVVEAAPRVLAAVAGTLGWPYAELWQVDGQPEALRRVSRYRAPGLADELPAPRRLAAGQGLAGAAWYSTEPVWRTDIDTSGLLPADAGTSCRLRTGLALPIRSAGRTLAVLTLFTDTLEDPQDSLVALLSGIVAHVGQFIERRRAEDLQRALSASKNEYLNLVGHELRTPLTAIGAYIELINDADPASTLADVQPMIDAIRRGSDRLRRLIEAILDLSGLDVGQAEIRRLPVDLAGVVAAALDKAQPAAQTKSHTLTADLPPRLPMTGDPDRLHQLVGALLDNAITYTPHGGQIEVILTRRDGTAELVVTDTGYGIPQRERAHVFRRFYRGATTTQHAIAGAGLGLSIAQLIAQRHGGHISLDEAMPGKPGSTFRVRLPVEPTDTPGDDDPPPPTE